MITLGGRTALVTGGSRGIGRATALMLAEAGADVGITYHTRDGEAADVARKIRALGRRAYAGGGDLSEPETATRLVREASVALGPIHILVLNAGVWPREAVPLSDMSPEQWHRTCRVNLDGIFYTVQAALPAMEPPGRIIVVGSTAGQRGEVGHADYAASKGALMTLTRSLAGECAPDHTVNLVAPGWVDTEMSEENLAGAAGDRIRAEIPLGRIAAPEDIAGPILFLASDLARQMTGSVLSVNGGSVLSS